MKTGFLIFLGSFLILYLELSLIRFLPAHILYLGFFTNLVLIASFLGVGLGFLLGRFNSLIFLTPPLLLVLILLTKILSASVNVDDTNVIFFKGDLDPNPLSIPNYILLPMLFSMIAAVFVPLGQTLSKLFLSLKNPLKAYTWDILGSLFGITVFYLGSYLSLPPAFWFGIFSLSFILLLKLLNSRLLIGILILTVVILVSFDGTDGKKTFWTPYYKVDLVKEPDRDSWHLFANNSNHQYFSRRQDAPIYSLIFSKFTPREPIQDALIIGSGTGQDLSAALAYGIKNIDAVEIDPKIYQIGKELHPERPYQDPRVSVTIDDGRNFLHNTDKKYDLIIFALTDSLVLASGKGDIRLESYLFTTESFIDIRNHLNPNGLFIIYNDYRKQWLIDRLSSMMDLVFDNPPIEVIMSASDDETGRIFIAQKNKTEYSDKADYSLPRDDWPFLYLKDRVIPSFYLVPLGIILFISFAITFFILRKDSRLKSLGLPRLAIFFLLGAAFSLIETKSIVQLNMLFGSTWLVSGLAFAGILINVLVACFFIAKKWLLNVKVSLILLLFGLCLQYFIPTQNLLVENPLLRLGVAVPFFFLPIFFANLVFASLFSKSKTPELDFGANLLGLVLGGIIEYIALISGYSILSLIAALLYLIAALILWRKAKTVLI